VVKNGHQEEPWDQQVIIIRYDEKNKIRRYYFGRFK
jgi:hypothetical protein